MYKNEQKLAVKLENEGKAIIIAPENDIADLKRFEKNKAKLRALYDHGYDCAVEKASEIITFLNNE